MKEILEDFRKQYPGISDTELLFKLIAFLYKEIELLKHNKRDY